MDKPVKIRFRPWMASLILFALALFFFAEAMLVKSLNYTFGFIGYGGTWAFSHIKLGKIKISLYWAAQIAGVFGMIIICFLRRGRYNIKKPEAVITGILLAVFGYAGAKILYILENLEHVKENGLSLGGVSFFGTVFFIPLIIPLIALIIKKRPLEYLDYCTPAGLIMLACIRVGCFMNGCCKGISFWFNERPVTVPVQLLEACLDLALLEIILRFEDNKALKGKLYFIFMIGYGAVRFVLEFIRNTPKTHFGLSNGQWFSLVSIVIGLAAFFILKRRQTNE